MTDIGGGKAREKRRNDAKDLAAKIARTLENAGKRAFALDVRSVAKNQISMPSSGIQDDMYECAGLGLVKSFHSQSIHASYLQMQRVKGHVGTVV